MKKTNANPVLQKIYHCYRTLTTIDVSEYENNQAQLVFPILPIPLLGTVCKTAAHVFNEEPDILRINSDVIIVGDIHGHILDLFRIFRKFGHPPKQTYLFLGDIVDRGEFSSETAIYILLLKCLFPNSVYVIRGNHEFSKMWENSGFNLELTQIYGQEKVDLAIHQFEKVFSFLPLAAIVNDTNICLHGGIGPDFTDINSLNSIKRPLNSFDDEPVLSILWSDPNESVTEYIESPRGSGYFFGAEPLKTFLEANNLTLLIRGHQCIDKGCEFGLNEQVVTVFSASFYCGNKPNKAGVLIIKSDNSREVVTFPALRYIMRYDALFLESSSETSLQLVSKPSKPPPSPLVSSNGIFTSSNQLSTNSDYSNPSNSCSNSLQNLDRMPDIASTSSTYNANSIYNSSYSNLPIVPPPPPLQLTPPKAPSTPSGGSPRRLRKDRNIVSSYKNLNLKPKLFNEMTESIQLAATSDVAVLTRSQPLLFQPSPPSVRRNRGGDDDLRPARKGNSILANTRLKKESGIKVFKQKSAFHF
ncbi:Ser/Thr protein phosphatase [Tritrichomonas foetus]|uniref:Serine/threonine-protein phosphatase n=1 Tax=Tritrichomonas foetus TaxID=1144522 RepID=A0A1J4KK00_9EUKA|nr:Ser/Thr protein phosphatase [Tritrichomonas foetus]|eukprot:OHT10006.1 Ser/Thr protein phosphatase [Tritrichomonas foetus]